MSCSKCNVTANNADVVRNVRLDYNSLPYLDISSTTTNISHLTNSDVDLHMPYDLNFNYYDTHEFHDNQYIIECFSGNNCFSALNCNIRRLSANFDNLANMLHELYFPFSLIGLTETKLKHNQHSVSNVTLKGYRFVSQPSNPNAEGVGFFVKDNIKHTLRIDLTVTKNEFEALWVEVRTFLFRKVVRMYFLNLGVKGFDCYFNSPEGVHPGKKSPVF